MKILAVSEFAKQYHEKMFPDCTSVFSETDSEFMERFENFAFDEVINQDDLDDKTRFMAILAALLGCQGSDMFRGKHEGLLEIRSGGKPSYQFVACGELLRGLLHPDRT